MGDRGWALTHYGRDRKGFLEVGVDSAERWRMGGHSRPRRKLVPRDVRDGDMLRECKHPEVTKAWN